MKNVLKSGLYLFVFAMAGVLFQISCSNSDDATTTLVNPTASGKIVYARQTTGSSYEIWTCDYDGSNQALVNTTLPANVEYSTTNANRTSVKISPDGQKIFFIGFNTVDNRWTMYSCDFDGSNVQPVVALPASTFMEIGGVN